MTDPTRSRVAPWNATADRPFECADCLVFVGHPHRPDCSKPVSKRRLFQYQAAHARSIVASWPESMRKAIWPPRKEKPNARS